MRYLLFLKFWVIKSIRLKGVTSICVVFVMWDLEERLVKVVVVTSLYLQSFSVQHMVHLLVPVTNKIIIHHVLEKLKITISQLTKSIQFNMLRVNVKILIFLTVDVKKHRNIFNKTINYTDSDSVWSMKETVDCLLFYCKYKRNCRKKIEPKKRKKWNGDKRDLCFRLIDAWCITYLSRYIIKYRWKQSLYYFF